MDRMYLGYCFDLQDNLAIDEEVDPVGVVDELASIRDGKAHLALERDPPRVELEGQARFVSGLQ